MFSRAEDSEDSNRQNKIMSSTTTSSSSMFQLSSSSSKKTAFHGFQKKEVVRCMVCGGRDCPKCGVDAYKKLQNPAIDKLHSHWITDYIVAMQRPNNKSLEAGALADFKKKKVTAIFNLTEPGEHPFCGPGIVHECGFPYCPENFMHVGIKHFNFSWQDMTVPSMQQMFDLVNIALHEIEAGGKIAVHCHAGFGRTGITCAAVMIAHEQLEASNVINYIRKRRPGSIQTSAQEEFVRKFEKAYHGLMHIFPAYEVRVTNGHSGILSNSSASHTPPADNPQSPPTNANNTSSQNDDDEPISANGPFQGIVSPRRTSSQQSLTSDRGAVSPRTTPRKNSRSPPNTRNNSTSPLNRANTVTSPPLGSAYLAEPAPTPRGGGAAAASALRKRSTLVAVHVMHHKTIAQTTKDQQYLLNVRDYSSGLYKYTHKIIYVISQAICMLAKDHFTMACLAITGLTKLAIKNTLNSLIDIDDRGAQRSDQIFGIIAGPLIRRRSSFMVATNALSESSEEGMLIELKKELNMNKWTKLLSLGDIISSSLRFSSDSVSKISKLSRSTSSNYSKSRLRTMNSIKELKNENDNESITEKNTNANKSVSEATDLILPNVNASPTAAVFQPHTLASIPASPTNSASQSHSQSDRADKERTVNFDPTLAPSTVPHAPLLSGQSPPTAMSNRKTSFMTPTAVPPSSVSASAARKGVNFRGNSLKQSTDADYAKSKKVASNLIAQLLLDFIETRKDPIFSDEIIQSLIEIWNRFGDIYEPPDAKEPASPKIQTIRMHDHFQLVGSNSNSQSNSNMNSTANSTSASLVDEIMQLLITKLDRYKIELLNAMINIYVALHDVVKSSDQYQQQYSEIMQNTSRIPGYQNALQTLQMLQTTVFNDSHPSANHSPMPSQQAVERRSVSPPRSTTTSRTNLMVESQSSSSLMTMNQYSSSDALECMEALDALVGLRFAVACMHGRKLNASLIKNRSLTVDLVKLFLLKTSHAEFVIINNITFNEEHYQQIKNHLGIELLYQLDIVFRTLHLLVDYHWNELNVYREEELLGEHIAADQRRNSGERHKVVVGGGGEGDIVMWNLFDYDDAHPERQQKIQWNENNLTNSTTLPSISSPPRAKEVKSPDVVATNATTTAPPLKKSISFATEKEDVSTGKIIDA